MPTYLVHGFRWPRPLIRIHIILQNLDDAAAEWLVGEFVSVAMPNPNSRQHTLAAPETTTTMLDNFHTIHPDIMSALPTLRFVEQHDPDDELVKSQPYAYVADIVHEIDLSAELDELKDAAAALERGARAHGQPHVDAMAQLRDKLAADAKLAWYVVVCGDEERDTPESGATTPTASSTRQSDGSASGEARARSTSASTQQSRSYINEPRPPAPKPKLVSVSHHLNDSRSD